MRLTCIYLLAKIVHGRICNHTDVYVDGKFAIDNCVELDFSCPATSTSRAPACRNALLPREVAALGVALATPSAGSVTSLNLRGSPLGPAGVTALAGALTKLTTLSFASCRIGDKGVKAITKSLLEGESQVLQRLDLAHNSVSDDGVRPLATAFKRDNSLQVLDLSWNAIGQRGGRYLGEALKESHNLLELRLSFNGVADRGARSLGEALGVNSALRLLNLEHNSIKEEGGRALAKGLRTNGALRTLLLDGNGLSNATLLEAAAALVAAPELPSPTTSASERASDTRRASAMSDEDIEEISFDDDVDATAEAAAEAAAEARDQQEADASTSPCEDGGPWACEEADCPAPRIDCTMLAELGVCASRFSDVWEVPPKGLEATVISTRCLRSCRQCASAGSARSDPRDEL